MEQAGAHAMAARYRADVGAWLKVFRGDPRVLVITPPLVALLRTQDCRFG